jgi:hypothetical protein
MKKRRRNYQRINFKKNLKNVEIRKKLNWPR